MGMADIHNLLDNDCFRETRIAKTEQARHFPKLCLDCAKYFFDFGDFLFISGQFDVVDVDHAACPLGIRASMLSDIVWLSLLSADDAHYSSCNPLSNSGMTT
jgi:hypothetical protein